VLAQELAGLELEAELEAEVLDTQAGFPSC